MGKSKVVTLVYDEKDEKPVKLAVRLFAEDIQRITGKMPVLETNLKKASGEVIVIGSVSGCKIVKDWHRKKILDTTAVSGQWETWQYRNLEKPSKKIGSALLVMGSDARGTAYGVLELSRRIGVSPWYYWADVTPEKKEMLSVEVDDLISGSPSVKYRGIFLNDEDWGLQPWAAKTLEPETGDIGPKTYARIFELLLRLKANLIWPAMHPCTGAFFANPQNIKIAEKYGIVIGSSHCEQMLCNNVGEWKKEFGPFNYFTNREKIFNYWEQRVAESKVVDAIYTLGMRGVHDSGIEGAASMEEKVDIVKQVIDDQRGLLKKYISKDVTTVPQALIPYKEVLEIYDQGLDLPDDVTVVWPDDNYGYIRRLSDANEQRRSGGAGVYYHASYWGRPHDYLWLSTTNPWLIWEEMQKAYENGARNTWVLNVGDIKPLEYNIDLFLSMAWNSSEFNDGHSVKQHLENWHSGIFGLKHGVKISSLMQQYYQLAFERRPEFMGWSQTEPTTQVRLSGYNHFAFNDEGQKRIECYDRIEKQVEALYNEEDLNPSLKAAFYQLVYYPVVAASNMNKKYLFRDKAECYARQGRTSATEYARQSLKAHNRIVEETQWFNEHLSKGKWRHILSSKPRNLPVFKEPDFDLQKPTDSLGWELFAEGSYGDSINPVKKLPVFYPWYDGAYFIDIYLKGKESVDWEITSDVPWLEFSVHKGTLTDRAGEREVRVWVKADWTQNTDVDLAKGKISIYGNGKMVAIDVWAENYKHPDLGRFKGGIENNGVISLFAENYTRLTNQPDAQWKKLDGLGHTGASMFHECVGEEHRKNSNGAEMSFDVFVVTPGEAMLTLFAIPTHPINKDCTLSISVSMDKRNFKEVDFRTFGRSAQWKENVLSNTAKVEIPMGFLSEGKHTLTIKGIDPGVILDRLLIETAQNDKNAYSVIPETRMPEID